MRVNSVTDLNNKFSMEFLNFDAIIQNHQKIIDFDLCSVKFSDFT